MQSHRSRHGGCAPLVILLYCLSLPVLLCPDAAARQQNVAPSSGGLGSYTLDESFLQEEVRECLGIPYRRGGSSRSGMDCSGFSMHVYSKLFGVGLPHQASEQYRLGILRDTSQEPLQMGDLIFFKKKSSISHVGIYLADGKFVHSVGGKGVVISSLENPYWKSLLAGSRRLMGLETEGFGSRAQVHASADLRFDEQSSLRLRLSVLLQKEGAFSGLPAELPWTTFGGNPWDGWEDLPFLVEVGYERRFASEMGLFQDFRVRPFLMLIEGDRAFPTSRHALGGMGLTASLSTPLRTYDLAVALGYGDRLESTLWQQPSPSGKENELTLSVNLQYRVRDMMRISFDGQHTFGDLPQTVLGSSNHGRGESDLFLLFDLSY